ncbi:MAG: proteasome assembly chaperone family protein [Halobacteriaceae archaeon]
MPDVTFHEQRTLDATAPTLIEGLPGTGLVASIAVDQITEQLGLDQYGRLGSEAIPPVASFADGLVRDSVRVYAGADPDVMTLQSDVPIPPAAFHGLGECVLGDLCESFDRAVFVAGAPAESEEERGEVTGVATTDAVRGDLRDADVQIAEGPGAVGGVTGALASACDSADVPAALLLVRADPRLPDPAAARSVVEDALEPLVEFAVDTGALEERAERIQAEKEQLAEQLQQLQDGGDTPRQAQTMFQ